MVVADLAGMTTLAAAPQEFVDLLRSGHATIMGGRPDKQPGVFKEAANRAGDSLFVLPGLVAGTLRAGWGGAGRAGHRFRACRLHDVPRLRGAPVR